MTLETLEELSKREAEIKKQLDALITLRKTHRELNAQLRKVKIQKNAVAAKLYFSRKAKQVELANAALCSQSSISRIIREA